MKTYYHCQLLALPQLEKPVHLTHFEILINKKNKKYFHHVLVYQCENNFQPESDISQQCGEIPLPFDVISNCIKKLVITWAIGGDTVICQYTALKVF